MGNHTLSVYGRRGRGHLHCLVPGSGDNVDCEDCVASAVASLLFPGGDEVTLVKDAAFSFMRVKNVPGLAFCESSLEAMDKISKPGSFLLHAPSSAPWPQERPVGFLSTMRHFPHNATMPCSCSGQTTVSVAWLETLSGLVSDKGLAGCMLKAHCACVYLGDYERSIFQGKEEAGIL